MCRLNSTRAHYKDSTKTQLQSNKRTDTQKQDTKQTKPQQYDRMMMMMMMMIIIIIIINRNSNVILWESTISSHFTETPQCFVTQICCSPQIVCFIPRTVTQPFKTGMHKLSKNVKATTKFSVLEE